MVVTYTMVLSAAMVLLLRAYHPRFGWHLAQLKSEMDAGDWPVGILRGWSVTMVHERAFVPGAPQNSFGWR